MKYELHNDELSGYFCVHDAASDFRVRVNDRILANRILAFLNTEPVAFCVGNKEGPSPTTSEFFQTLSGQKVSAANACFSETDQVYGAYLVPVAS